MAAWRYEISLLVLKKYFTRSLHSLVKYFQHLKRNFVSPRSHVISSIYQTSFALMPSFFMITSSFKSPSWHTNDDIIPPNFMVWA